MNLASLSHTFVLNMVYFKVQNASNVRVVFKRNPCENLRGGASPSPSDESRTMKHERMVQRRNQVVDEDASRARAARQSDDRELPSAGVRLLSFTLSLRLPSKRRGTSSRRGSFGRLLIFLDSRARFLVDPDASERSRPGSGGNRAVVGVASRRGYPRGAFVMKRVPSGRVTRMGFAVRLDDASATRVSRALDGSRSARAVSIQRVLATRRPVGSRSSDDDGCVAASLRVVDAIRSVGSVTEVWVSV